MIELDQWQKDILSTEGNVVVRAGRQVGKSTIISIKASEFAVKSPDKTILVIASVERQAGLLFEKILNYLLDNYRSKIKIGKDRPTKHIINLKNGSRIICVPTGISGTGIRGYTIDLLICEECAYIPKEVFTAVTPMLAVTKGVLWALSTPKGREGFFYECFNDDSYTKFHISSEECGRIPKDFLEREKKRMTNLQYSQEYLAVFLDEIKQFFPTELIKKCMTLSRGGLNHHSFPASGDLYLGVDCARLGEDQSVLLSVKKINDNKIKIIDMEIMEKTLTTETAKRILIADKRYNYEKIYIDDGGVGAGIFDQLLYEDQTRHKVIAINNASKSLNKSDSQRRRLLKEDLYDNLLKLMERGEIDLWDDDELYLSLTSVQYEYNDKNQIKIYGNYTHITESLARSVWCMTGKHLNLWCGYTGHGIEG